MKKRKHSRAELDNDPSLRWCPYRTTEVVWSDSHQTEMRFIRYEDDGMVLATLNGIAEVAGRHDPLTVRRLTAQMSRDELKPAYKTPSKWGMR